MTQTLESPMEQQKQREGFKFGTAIKEETKQKLLQMKIKLAEQERAAVSKKS